jgi:hypothetical protein
VGSSTAEDHKAPTTAEPIGPHWRHPEPATAGSSSRLPSTEGYQRGCFERHEPERATLQFVTEIVSLALLKEGRRWRVWFSDSHIGGPGEDAAIVSASTALDPRSEGGLLWRVRGFGTEPLSSCREGPLAFRPSRMIPCPISFPRYGSQGSSSRSGCLNSTVQRGPRVGLVAIPDWVARLVVASSKTPDGS